MNLKARLNDILEEYNLLDHPFYRAWSEGTLPVEALQTYAREYGAFVAQLPDGWRAAGDEETVEEEMEHLEMWEDFATALETEVGDGEIPQVLSLLETAEKLYGDYPSTLGGLYAFEAQQPETAQSKLEGLREFYSLPKEVEVYFEEHARNHHESEKLLGMMDKLAGEDQEKVVAGCAAMSQALWDALTGIHEGHF